MKIYLVILLQALLSVNIWAAVDFGDGSDGVCAFTTAAPPNKATYNCTELIVAAAEAPAVTSATVNSYITIKVLGDVNIEGTLDVSASGSTSGPGGTDGGDCSGSGNATTPCSNIDAPGTGGGRGGTNAVDGSGGGAAGGGGSGGFYGSSLGMTAAGNGTGGLGTNGVAGVTVTSGFGSESDFRNSISGGVGGGAGGSGDDGGGGGSYVLGGDGGAGGGAIRIYARGTISVTGSILANGGIGANGASSTLFDGGGGGGGGGSGGAIYLLSNTELILNGSLLADGGAGGTGGSIAAVFGGDGGNGGKGRIRLDSPSGGYTGSPTFNGIVPYKVSLESVASFESEIAYNCAFKEGMDFRNYIYTFILAFLTFIGLGAIFRRQLILKR